MRLKSLEMVGFKSFAERTILQFPPGIASIVGPNGCGKSNVVDALRWVMGEQSARHLRGQLMGDVIFNGSERLPPTGMAEVSLILDNEDGRGPAEYSSLAEIMITRRLFRSGESEYEINKISCRLKDIIELFLGTGVGNKAYSMVEQGRVDEMINAKPEDRRALIEEAAGTSKYRSRKLVAERKLERTHQNLLRVNDIVREIERQIRSMELQAKKAERYRALKQELKDKDLAWSARQKKILESEIAQVEMKLKESEDRLAHLLATLHTKEAESESLRLSLLETEREVGAKQEAVYQQKVLHQGIEQKIHFTRKDRDELEETKRKIQTELASMQDKLQALSREIDELKKAQESFVQLSLFEENFLKDKETELEKVRSEISSLQSGTEQEKGTLIELANRTAHLKNDLGAAERKRGELQAGLARNREENSGAFQSLASWTEKREERKAALERSSERAGEVERESNEASAAIQKWTREKEELEQKITALKERLQDARSLLLSLEELQRNYDGYQEGVRAIMLKRQRESAFEGVYGLVAEVIEAPEDYEKALAAVLGDRLQYIIVQSHEAGLKAIEHLKQESSGRGSFIPMRLSKKGERRPLPLGQPEVIAPLLERVSVKEGYREIADYLLGDVVLVRDLPSAFQLWSRNGFINTLVTLEGEIIDPSGVVTGGSVKSLEGSFLSQRRRIKELQALSSEIESQLHEEDNGFGILRERLERMEARRAVLVEESHNLALEKVRLEHDLLQAEQEVARLNETLQGRAQEAADLSEMLKSVEEEIAGGHRQVEAVTRERTEREKTLAERQEALAVLTRESETLEANVTDSRIRGAALGERKEHVHLDLENRLKLRQDLLEQVGSREAQRAEAAAKGKGLEEALRAAEASLEDEKKGLAELEERLEGSRREYREMSRCLTEIDEAIKEVRPLTEATQEEKNRFQLMISEKGFHLQHLADTLREKYGLELKEIQGDNPAESFLEEEVQRDIEELRRKLERMGEVNLAAIGEFEELSSRYQFLSQQKGDLEKSIADLQSTIAKLNRICRSRFKESFEEINQKFQDIFPRLFRGGKAHMVLTDENDYLETGVEIVGQPPGKKLQSISLMSGGEKALTAVSLLFAIFLTKPSPFCLLDEVDAPLDDANIDRFNEMVKEMSQISQFILITHNKRTMQVAELLYGITMEEPGASKVVSVKMS